MEGNTSINPFFYGTYLGETMPYEPVTRTKKQAFQADAVGAAHQLTLDHFQRPHTFRLEWQPGSGGRLDWFVKGYRVNETFAYTGDGKGQDWIRAYGIDDTNLKDLMGSQIPNEPSYLIMNTAISSTWGFPFDTPEWCSKCYDCDDPTCACSFYPGFCEMIRSGDTAMYIDSIRVYQSRNASAHVGANHTIGCDPPDYPTSEWITGHSYRYMRNPPFVYEDKHPIRRVQRGGGACESDADCGGNLTLTNWTAVYEKLLASGNSLADTTPSSDDESTSRARGTCVSSMQNAMFSSWGTFGKVCQCNLGFTGPHCLALDAIDDTPSAHKIRVNKSPFHTISNFAVPSSMLVFVALMVSLLFTFLVSRVRGQKMPTDFMNNDMTKMKVGDGRMSVITGTSI